MSSKRRSLPRKKPGRTAHDEIDEELPVLQPIEDDLPELPLLGEDDEVDDGPVKIDCVESDEAAFDKVLEIAVPAMEKAEVQAAVTPALQRAAKKHGDGLRWQRVLVRFGGEALIGSALKAVVTEALLPHKPCKLVVRRGFGDELLHEAPAPKLVVNVTADGDKTQVAVETGELQTADLPVLLPAELSKLAAGAKDKRFVFTFQGAAKADAGVRELLTSSLRAAGARHVAVGARVLFDRDLLDALQVRVSKDSAVLTVTPFADPAMTEEAIAMFRAERAAELDDKNVRIWFAKPGQPAEVGACVSMCRDAGALRISLGEDGNEDVVWPFLIRCEPGREVTLHLEAAGRSRAALLTAFLRECGEHTAAARDKAVVIDWPAGFHLDAEVVDGALAAAIKQLAPKRLACTIAGDQQEPFAPPPFTVAVEGGVQTLQVDVDAGKPPELLRAFDRCLPKLQGAWRGQAVSVVIQGQSAPSRSLLRTICGAVETAGAMRLQVVDHGNVDVLLPPMLTISNVDAKTVRIAALSGERTPAQQESALARELDGAELAGGVTVRVVPSPIDELLVAALAAKGVAAVVLDGAQPVRVHPRLFAAPEVAGHTPKSKTVKIKCSPAGDAAADTRQAERELPALLDACRERKVTLVWAGEVPAAVVAAFVAGGAATLLHERGDGAALQLHPPIEAMPVSPEPVATASPAAAPAASAAAAPAMGSGVVTLLGRRDEAVPPLAILGIASGDTGEHVAAVEAALQPMLPAFRGRAILLVLKDGEVDAPVRSGGALVQMLARVVSATSAATMVFRGPDAQGRPHFQVVHTTLRALPMGGAFGDPRPSR